MSERKLKEALEKLKEASTDLDQKQKEELAILIGRIEEKIQEPHGSDKHAGLLSQIEASTVGFEGTHPRINSLLQEIAAVLAHLGI